MRLLLSFLLLVEIVSFCPDSLGQGRGHFLIAHRGGVVDSSHTENGMSALKQAAKHGYRMIETDMRVTKDGVLIANHDADFRRYYGVNRKVLDMTWGEIETLRSAVDGDRPLLLEEVLQFCRRNKLQVMLDNKIAGNDTILFVKVVALLDRFDLRKTALMIGTEDSTPFFTGKIKLSCSREQLENNMLKPGYKSTDFYLFERASGLSKDDVDWTKRHGIVTVAAINKYHYSQSPDALKAAESDCRRLLSTGVTIFQIDSEFGRFLGIK